MKFQGISEEYTKRTSSYLRRQNTITASLFVTLEWVIPFIPYPCQASLLHHPTSHTTIIPEDIVAILYHHRYLSVEASLHCQSSVRVWCELFTLNSLPVLWMCMYSPTRASTSSVRLSRFSINGIIQIQKSVHIVPKYVLHRWAGKWKYPYDSMMWWEHCQT